MYISQEAARRQIMRSGIPFGPEVTPEEARTCKTRHTRGLAFVCYQSNLLVGFEFMQRRRYLLFEREKKSLSPLKPGWCNNENFPPIPQGQGAPNLSIGQDPIGEFHALALACTDDITIPKLVKIVNPFNLVMRTIG